MPIFKAPKPSFIILGAQKAATSSLYSYLIRHKNILPAVNKEVEFFNRDFNYKKGIDWYHNQFIGYNNPFKKHISFDVSPDYLYKPYVAKRIKRYNPKIKLIIILRDPVKRAFSAYNMYEKFNTDNYIPSLLIKPYFNGIRNNLKKTMFSNGFPSFEEVIDIELDLIKSNSQFLEPSFIRRGIYIDQLRNYYQHFEKEQILILSFEDVVKNTKKALSNILTFINLEPYSWNRTSFEIRNAGKYKSPINKMTNQKLQAFYTPYNDELSKLLDRKFDW